MLHEILLVQIEGRHSINLLPGIEIEMADPHSKSNFDQVRVQSYSWKVEVDFSSKKLVCSLTIHAKTLKDGCTQMVCMNMIMNIS